MFAVKKRIHEPNKMALTVLEKQNKQLSKQPAVFNGNYYMKTKAVVNERINLP